MRALRLRHSDPGRVALRKAARAALRREWRSGVEDPVRRREILDEALAHVDRQLELVRRRRDQIAQLERDLSTQRKRIGSRLRRLQPSVTSQ